MHWPNPETFLESWKQMEELYREGLCRAIGVCNFHEHHMEELISIAEILPVVNQIELHPLLSQKPLVNYCTSKRILIEAYSPLARMHKKLINNPIMVSLSEKYNKSVVQIILRWNFQNGIIVIPKTSNKERLKHNIDIFDFNISTEDMKTIDGINKNFRVRYDPDNCDFNRL
jgi:diketogulonate reductase-like aldo/keto reductase